MSLDWHLPNLNAAIDHWALHDPTATAMLQHEDGRVVSYKQFRGLIDFFALRLLDAGVTRGDRVATQLPTIPEHFALLYACFKIGAIAAPLDLRLQAQEVTRDLAKIQPCAFFCLGETPVRDFREVASAAHRDCKSLRFLVQFTPNAKRAELAPGAISISQFMSKPRLLILKAKDLVLGQLAATYKKSQATDPALIIFTTGTTGEPKPAMLSHQNILVQNEVLRRSVDLGREMRILANLPPSHVAGTTETVMTTWFSGGVAVLLRIFDAKLTLEAIAAHKVNALGQIPTQYRLEWARDDFASYDLSSIQYAIYAGSAVDEAFLNRLAQMAPRFGTGLGMTESAGFVTFTPANISVAEMAGQVGTFYPDLAKTSVRAPMQKDGRAGDELPDGEVGEICYHPPIVFLGYYEQPEATRQCVSSEGILYTGDMGHFEDKGSYRALYLSGRERFVIKQKGYRVYPDEVQTHLAKHPAVDIAEIVGVEHRVFDEGIFAFVRPKPGISISAQELDEHCKQIAAYKRPQHFHIWSAEQELPLTRVAKVDKLVLHAQAVDIVKRLRAEGSWDATI